jgi:hypothetical protein
MRFLWKPPRAYPSMKNSASTFRTRTQWNVLRDPQLPPDAKTQVRRNVSRRTFNVNSDGPIRVWKIVRRRFAPRTHRNALRDPQIPLNAKR